VIPRPSLPAGFPPFVPRWPWWGADLQTVRNILRRPPVILAGAAGVDLEFPMDDGTGDVLLGTLHQPAGTDSGRPVAVLVHGLTGDADSAYVLATAVALLGRGYPVLRLNLRGAGPSRALCREHYHAGRSGDLRRVLESLPHTVPDLRAERRGLVPVGYSLGANILLKLLGEGAPETVRAAISISAPIDLARTAARFLDPRNHFYHQHLLARMKREALAGPLDPAERAAVPAVRTVRDFDERFVAPRNGFGTADRYYALCSGRRFLDAIAVPTLVIHALDDPWIPGTLYREVDWTRNPRLVPLLPRHGGHVGFHGAGPVVAWHDRCILQLLDGL
jgi:predicted alpha/beta-fold hydrolase